jgi:hypothetical protein
MPRVDHVRVTKFVGGLLLMIVGDETTTTQMILDLALRYNLLMLYLQWRSSLDYYADCILVTDVDHL